MQQHDLLIISLIFFVLAQPISYSRNILLLSLLLLFSFTTFYLLIFTIVIKNYIIFSLHFLKWSVSIGKSFSIFILQLSKIKF